MRDDKRGKIWGYKDRKINNNYDNNINNNNN